MQQQITDNRQALDSLQSGTCPACGSGKRPERTLCGACYGRLPSPLASALYKRLYDGYLEAVHAALRYLKSAPAGNATCRRCPAPIIFAKQNPTVSNPQPQNNPLNAQPHPNGNLRLDRTTMRYDVLTGDALKAAREKGEELYLSHFADCKYRQQFRRTAAQR